MPETDTDVLIVGAAPTGLTLARELALAGVRTQVLERLPKPRTVKKAGGLGGRMLEMLRYRGLAERFEAASGQARPTPRFPFGGLHVDLSQLADNPMQALLLPQPQLESLLEELARDLGAEIHREHELVALNQDPSRVTAEVRGPDGPYRITARYLVGCDGAHSRVRAMAGIPFPGITYPEVNRLGSFGMPDSVTRLDDGGYEIPGYGGLPFGYTQTANGVIAISSYTANDLSIFTSEEETRAYDDDEPMTIAEFEGSIRRVLGANIPLEAPTRLTRFTFHAKHVERYRAGRVFVAGDAAHLFPSGGVAVSAGMLDAVNLAWKLAADVAGWAPEGLLDTYHEERHLAGARTLLHTQAQVALRRGLDSADDALRVLFTELLTDPQTQRRIGAFIAGSDIRYPMPDPAPHALAGTFAPDLVLRTEHGVTSVSELMHPARPILLVLAKGERDGLREVAAGWKDRVDVHTATTDDRPADALLIRPDAHIAWAADESEPVISASAAAVSAGEHAEIPTRGAAPALRRALAHWFGDPR